MMYDRVVPDSTNVGTLSVHCSCVLMCSLQLWQLPRPAEEVQHPLSASQDGMAPFLLLRWDQFYYIFKTPS